MNDGSVPHADEGGEAPCLLPLFGSREPVTADLAELAAAARAGGGAAGAFWSLPHDGDLDANLVVLHPGSSIGEHVNREVDVLIVVLDGTGTVTVDGAAIDVTRGSLVLVPKELRRAVGTGASGLEYLSIHRRRGGLQVR